MNTKTILFNINDMQPFPVATSAANFNGLAGWMSNASTTSSVQPAIIPSQGQSLYFNIYQDNHHYVVWTT